MVRRLCLRLSHRSMHLPLLPLTHLYGLRIGGRPRNTSHNQIPHQPSTAAQAVCSRRPPPWSPQRLKDRALGKARQHL